MLIYPAEYVFCILMLGVRLLLFVISNICDGFVVPTPTLTAVEVEADCTEALKE
jgi:hypothetical protein